MEQIIMTKPNGSIYPLAVRRTATTIKSAKQNWALMGDDVVNVSIESPFPQSYGIGDKCTVFARDYKINRLPKMTKTGMRTFKYDLELEGVQYDLMRVTFDLTIETTGNTLQDVQADSLTGNLALFARVFIANANRVFPGKWVLGSCPDTKTLTLTFSESDNCLTAWQNFCNKFDVESEITQSNGVYTVNFVKSIGQTFPYTFEFGKGKGLYSLSRQNVDSSNIVTRLKVYGSTDNITNKYRASRLCLPGKTKAQSYLENANALTKYGIYEATKYFDDIKPTFKGSVTAIISDNVLKLVDTKMFDLNELESDGKTTKYLIDGTSAKVHFNTGNLAGYEFEVHSYDHNTHTFTLVKETDDRGDIFPSSTSTAFQFAVGDEYKLIDVALPDTYTNVAETELEEQGEIYYNQNCQPKVKYSLNVTKAYLQKMVGTGSTVNIFKPGDFVQIKDSDIDVDKSVRIQSFERNLLDEYDYTLTISDTVTTTITNRVISDLIDIDKIININDLKDPAKARANWRSSREVLNMVFDPDGDYYTDKIKPNSIDTLALSVGAKSMQFGLQNTVLQPNYGGNKNVVKVTGGVLTHYTIVDDGVKSWTLADNTTTLNGDSSAFYIYARCSRTETTGTIIFSTEAIKVEQSPLYYCFLIGVINSVDTTTKTRTIYLQYGFTMINGRFIKTGRIESADGTTYFDLDNSEIGGRIVFTQNGSEKTLEELGNEALESKNYINNTLPGILSEIQSQLDGQIEQFFYAVDPSLDGEPNSEWTTTALKENHLGDLYYNTSTGKVWRYIKTTYNGFTSYSWSQLSDEETAQALATANDALALAKTKRRIFTATPYTPYEVGDLWVQGSNGDIMQCTTARDSGSFTSTDWTKASKYTNDAALTTFINGTYNSDISNITTQIDGKIESWFQTSDPSTSWTTDSERAKHVGDMWFNSNANKLKRYSSSYVWVDITDQKAIDAYNAASTAQDTADGKRRVFVSTPYAPYDIGDLWVDGTQLRRCATAKADGGTYNVNDWVTCVAYDNTKTVIDGGLVTSGTIQVAGDNTSILAGMTGNGTTADSVRFWAGASFENRATAPFRVLQDGSVIMSKATVEGIINAISGSIGGFSIAQGRIGNTYNSDSGMALYNSFIRFKRTGKYAAIGDLGMFGYDNLGNFALTSDSVWATLGAALLAKCRAGDGSFDYYYPQRALEIDGNVFGYGKRCFFDEGYIGQAYTDIITGRFNTTHKFHFTTNTTSYLEVNLPTKTMVDNLTNSKTVIFDLEIVCDRNMSNRIAIKSQTGAQMYNNDGGTIDYINMEKGDTLCLRYYNGGYHRLYETE